MKLDFNNLMLATTNISWAARNLTSTSEKMVAPINGSFSTIAGVSEAGGIHGRSLQGDPASAATQLLNLGRRLNSISRLLADNTKAFNAQENSNSAGLDIADQGGSAGKHVSFGFAPLTELPADPMLVVPPIVNVGPSLRLLHTALQGTNVAQLTAASTRWTEISTQLGEVVSSLESTAADLVAANDAEPVTKAAAALNEVATGAGYFIQHAGIMAAKTTGLASQIGVVQMSTHAATIIAEAITEPAQRMAFEQGMLSFEQGVLQSAITGTNPTGEPLLLPASASAGGSADVGLNAIAGSGQRYTTDGVVWPEEFVEALERGDIGQGSFEITNGEITGLKDVGGMSESAIRDTVNAANTMHQNALAEAGFTQGPMPLDAGSVGTHSASASAGNVATGGLSPSAGGIGGAGAPGASVGGAGGMSAGGGVNAVNGMAGGPGFAAGQGGQSGHNAGARGPFSAGSNNGVAGGTPRMPGAMGSGTGAGLGNGGLGSAGGPAGSAGPAGSGAGSSTTAGHVNTAGQGRQSGVGAGAGRGNNSRADGKKIKSVVTRVEINKNKRDLLGKRKAVVPGVLGAWVREQ